MAGLVLPNDEQRIVIVGATGSGKTHAACWHLSRRSYDRMPWIILDYKRDPLINSIQGLQELELGDNIPEYPGLYVVHPSPNDEDEIESLLWEIWRRGSIGVYVDEGYMIGNRSKGFRAILTQGRSKRIPLITLSQRPVWMDVFVFSESEFYEVFRLQHKKDVLKVGEYIPHDISGRLPKYQSYYYDAISDELMIMDPMPDARVILATFNTRLSRIPKVV